jgi:hypothetical protein
MTIVWVACVGGPPLIDRFGQPLGGRTAAAFGGGHVPGRADAERGIADAISQPHVLPVLAAGR